MQPAVESAPVGDADSVVPPAEAAAVESNSESQPSVRVSFVCVFFPLIFIDYLS